MGVSGIHAEGSNYTAIGNDLNSSNPDTAMGSGVVAEGSEGSEGSFSTNRENQDNFSPTQALQVANQPTQTEPETTEVDTEIVENQKTAEIALSAYGSTLKPSQDKGSENDHCLRTADNGGEQLHKLASAASIDEVAIKELVVQARWDDETLLMDLLVKYDKEEIRELEDKEALDLANRLKAEIFRQNLQQK